MIVYIFLFNLNKKWLKIILILIIFLSKKYKLHQLTIIIWNLSIFIFFILDKFIKIKYESVRIQIGKKYSFSIL
jgi:hypothetical protein